MLMRKLRESVGRMRTLIADCRSDARETCDARLSISLRDGRGKITHTHVRCLDMSKSGASFEYSEPVVMPAVVQIRAAEDGTALVANVRRCTPKGSGYEIGIEFCRDTAAKIE